MDPPTAPRRLLNNAAGTHTSTTNHPEDPPPRMLHNPGRRCPDRRGTRREGTGETRRRRAGSTASTASRVARQTTIPPRTPDGNSLAHLTATSDTIVSIRGTRRVSSVFPQRRDSGSLFPLPFAPSEPTLLPESTSLSAFPASPREEPDLPRSAARSAAARADC